MTKSDTPNNPQPAESAVETPEQTSAAEAEAKALWQQMAAKHADPQGPGGARSAAEETDEEPGGEQENAEVEAPAATEQAPKEEPNPKPGNETETDPVQAQPGKAPAAPAGASQDAPAADDDIWAKAANDPRTKALHEAFLAAPESARPAIEATQRRLLAQGQEIHLLRTERQSLKRASAQPAPAKTEAAEEPYDVSKDPDLAQIKADYPDVGAAMEKILSKALGSTRKEIDAKVAPIAAKTGAMDEAFEEQGLRNQGIALRELHPNYDAVVSANGFRKAFDEWLPTQTDEVKAMVEANNDYVRDARKASTVFKLFQADTGFGVNQAAPKPATEEAASAAADPGAKSATDPATRQQARRRQQLAGSSAVESRGQAAVTPDPEDGDYWFKHWSNKKRSAESHAN